MNKLITYSLVVLLSFFSTQLLFSNSNDEGTLKTKVVNMVTLEKLYPNPASKGSTIFVNLQLQQATIVNVVVLDMIGNKVVDFEQEVKVGDRDIHFHSDKLTEGVYFVNIISGESKQVQRLIIR